MNSEVTRQDLDEVMAKWVEQDAFAERLRDEAIEMATKCQTLQDWVMHCELYGSDHLQEDINYFCDALQKIAKHPNKSMVNNLLASKVVFNVPVIGPDWLPFTATITLERATATITPNNQELAIKVGLHTVSFCVDSTEQALKILLNLSVEV